MGMSTRFLARAAALALFLSVSGPALAQSSELIENATQALAGGDPERAYQLLSPRQEEFAGSPEYDFLLGISALDSGRPEEAVFALERVVAVEPDNSLARAELGRAYLRLGELDNSRRELEAVQADPDVPDEARETIERYLAAFDARMQETQTDWRGYVAIELGYDTNVNAGTDSRLVFVPAAFGGPVFVDIGEAGAEENSAFTRLSAGISVIHALTEQFALTGSLNGFQRLHEDGDDFETADVGGHLGFLYSMGPNNFTVAYQGDRFSVDGHSNRNANGGVIQWRRVLDAVSQLSVYGQFQRLTYRDQETRNANRWTGGIAYSRAFPDLRFSPVAFASFRFGDEQNFADSAPHIAHEFYAVTIGGQLKVTPETTVFASAEYEARNYDAPVPGFLNDREDRRYSLQLGLRWTPWPEWSVIPRVEFSRNDSNTAINDYDRGVVSVVVRRDFD